MKELVSRPRRYLVDTMHFGLRSLRRRVDRGAPIYFCLNSGRCGSTTLVRLLQSRGVRCCYHELRPDLHREGVDYYQHRIDAESVAAKLRKTRSGVFFEANNRLFSLAHPIRLAFPDARFVFLFRDGRDVVRSGLQRNWYCPEDRFRRLRLGSGAVGAPFEKICRYWADVNQRILSDMRTLGCNHILVRFEDLVKGQGLDQLEDFLKVRRSCCKMVSPTNRTTSWSVPPYVDWPTDWREQFDQICGPAMKLLGYSAPTDTNPTVAEPHLLRPHPSASDAML